MTSFETGPSWVERLNPRNWPLAWKLVAIGLVPALLALALGVLRVADQAGSAAELGRSSRLIDIREQVSNASGTLRGERNEAALFVAGARAGDHGLLDVQIGLTDTQVAEMRTAIGGTDELDDGTRSALNQAEGGLKQLPVLRTDATGVPSAVTADQIRDRYTDVIGRIDALDRALLRQLRTPGTAGLADALTAASNYAEQLALQHTVLGAATKAGGLSPGNTSIVSATTTQLAAFNREYLGALTPGQLDVFGNFADDISNDQRSALLSTMLNAAPGQPVQISLAEWDTAYENSRRAVDKAAVKIRDDLVAASTAAEERASNLAGVNSVILMLGLLLGITIAVLVARALIRSLRVLRTAALDVAERRLPLAVEGMRAGEAPDVTVDPVPLNSHDEVGQVARAFDAVHGQAIRLAADQALLQSNVSAMFVNLSRRSQALVERQLQLIEQLESNEQDADQLSNLFQLDHLATRMRRNSENLLVLAGTDLAKRNIAPVPMVDVLRAAVSEIEQYQRIVVQSPPSATLVGRAASDIVHLLAELLDNATNFSPPDSQVVMSTTRTPDGSIVVEIADRGVGMVDHELSDANIRLGGPSAVDVSASRRMGLFVVGRLGARHGIGVRLATSSAGPGAGLTASVTVPAYLVPSSEPLEAGRPAVAQRSSQMSAQGAVSHGVPPQRGGREGSLSALIAGTDGPASPAGIFDSPSTGGDGTFFGSPPSNGTPSRNGTAPTNGGPPALPNRRPGSSLRPDGPPDPPERPDPAEQAEADQTAARAAEEQRARDVALQARRDQEAADRAAQERAAKDRIDRDRVDKEQAAEEQAAEERVDKPAQERAAEAMSGEREQPAAEHNGNHNGVVHPDVSVAQESSAATNGSATNGSAPAGEQPANPSTPESEGTAGPPRPAERSNQLPQRLPRRPSQRPDPALEPYPSDLAFGNGAATPPRSTPAQVPPAPPTTPIPVIGRPGAGTPPPATPAGSPVPPTPELPPRQPQSAPRPTPQPSSQPMNQPMNQPEAAPQIQGEPPPQAGAHASAGAQQADAHEQPVAQAQPVAQPQPPTQQPLPQPRPVPRTAAQPQASRPAAPPASGPDELFAPSVPVIAEPSPPGRNTEASGFELGETTPIFEEIASAWFRSNRQIPVEYQNDEADGEPVPAPAPRHPFAPAKPSVPAPVPIARRTPPEIRPSGQQPGSQIPAAPMPASPRPAPRPQRPIAQPAPMAAPPAQPPPAQPPLVQPRSVAANAPSTPEFASEADAGWLAAGGIENDRPDEMTQAGLPKRRPRARLVPGSAGSAVLATPVTTTRSAETIRGRLASYQQGVRQGRENRSRGTQDASGSTKPATAGGNHDEERT